MAFIEKTKEQLVDEINELKVKIFQLESIIEGTTKPHILYKNNAIYQTILETTGTAIVIIEEDMILDFVNEKFAQLMGFPKNEIEGIKKWTEFVYEEDLERLIQYHHLRRASSNGAVKSYEVRLIDRNKNIKYAFLTVDMIPDTKLSIASIIDITDYKSIKESLIESENQFKNIIELLPVSLVILDNNDNVVYLNPKATEVFGYTTDDISTAQEWFDHVYTDSTVRDISISKWNQFVICDSSRHLITNYSDVQCKNGESKHCSFRIVKMNNGYRYIICDDITENVNAINAIKESENRFKSILSFTPNVAIEVFDINGKVLFWNSAAEKIFGFNEEYAIGKSLDQLILDEDANKEFLQTLINIDKNNIPIGPNEYIIKDKDGNIKTILSTIFSIPSVKGNKKEFICIDIDITERKNVEENLIRTQSILKASLEQTSAGIMIANKNNLQIILVNEAASEILGQTISNQYKVSSSTKEYITWKSYTPEGELYDNYDLPLVKCILTGNIYKNIEMRIVREDGGERWILVNASPIKDQEGNIIAGIIVFPDITNLKYAENALKESEYKYKSLTEQLPLGIYRTTKDGKVLHANPALAKILGYSTPDEIIDTFIPLSIYTDKKERIEQYDNFRSLNKICSHETMFKQKDGDYVWVRDTGRIISDNNDNVLYIDGILEDITDRKKAQEILNESELLYRTLFELSPIGIGLMNSKTDLVAVNKAMSTISGYETDKLILMNLKLLFFDYKDFDYMYSIISKESYIHNYTVELVREDYSIYYGKLNISNIILGGKNIFLFILEDITAQKMIETNLINAKEKAEEANRLKSSFLANISHELRTPLNVILGYSQIILREPEIKNNFISYIDRIYSSGKHLLSIINALLEVSKIEAGGITIKKTGFKLYSLMEDLNTFFSISILNKALGFKIEIMDDVPDVIYTDNQLLKQILINLIDNAIKFTSQGEIIITVKLNSNFELLFTISDTGIGIPEEKQDIIFEPFLQVENTFTRKYSGTGLGLSITKKYIELLDGKIWVESRLEQGSKFHFTILFEQPFDDIVDVKNIEFLQPFTNRPNHTVKNILLVEDNLDFVEIMKQIVITKMKHHLHVSQNSFEAFSMLEKYLPDIIFMDIQLPIMDGIQATKNIKNDIRFKNIPVIAITAFALENDKEKFLKAGFSDYISKPIDLLELEQRINLWLNKVK